MSSETYEQDHRQGNIGPSHHEQYWLRLVYMLVYGVILHVTSMVMWVICILQFVIVVASGEKNRNLGMLAQMLTGYISEALRFVSFNSEHKPFPFSPWSCNNDSDCREEQVSAKPPGDRMPNDNTE